MTTQQRIEALEWALKKSELNYRERRQDAINATLRAMLDELRGQDKCPHGCVDGKRTAGDSFGTRTKPCPNPSCHGKGRKGGG